MKFGGTTEDYWNHHYSWQMYLYDYDYSSHDWIADEALDMVLTSLYFDDWVDSQGNPFWDVEGNRRKIFLYATAGPDIGYKISIKSKSGITVSVSATTRNHHYYFDGARNPITGQTRLADYALDAARQAVKAIKNGDCNVGAFWLGVMSHFIADACLFLHVDPNVKDLQFEAWISGRMDSCQGTAGGSANNPYNPLLQYEFLQTTTSSLLVFPFAPDMCVRRVAYDTRFDSNFGGPDGSYTASWMLSTWQSLSGFRTNARTRADWLGWATAGEGTLQQDAYKFFQRLEDSVNLGVWYTANAMQWVIQKAGTYKCSQGFEDVKNVVLKQVSLSMFFSLFSLLGLTLIDYVLRSSEIWIVGLVLH